MTTETPKEYPLYNGSCHCGYTKYTARLSFTNPSPSTGAILTKCNCSICNKTGTLLATPMPESSFTLLSPTSEDDVTIYTFGGHQILHRFCPKCGIRCFFRGTYEYEGKKVDFLRVNVLTLDGREDGEKMPELKDVKVKYFDGKNMAWGLSDQPCQGGVW